MNNETEGKPYLMYGPNGFGTYIHEQGGILAPSSLKAEHLLIPGFVDTHFHGAFGLDFMTCDPADMVTLCGKLAEVGYEKFLPTTVTAPLEAVEKALLNLIEHPMIGGFHLEGPFISPKHPGAQPKQFILDIPDESDPWWKILNDSRMKIITMAPELNGGLGLIQKLSSQGVHVNAGHTDATFEEMELAKQAGLSGITHTYNAMRPFHHRQAGTVGYALSTHDLWCELIYDRVHVCAPAAEILFRSKPQGVVAISDATMAAGLPAGTELQMWGLNCIVGEHDVRLRDGTLAGSTITLLDAFRNLYSDFGPETAIKSCCLNPRKVLQETNPAKVYVEIDSKLQIVDIHQA